MNDDFLWWLADRLDDVASDLQAGQPERAGHELQIVASELRNELDDDS